jgi:hypothetical protein
MSQDSSRIVIMEGLYSLYKSLLQIEDVGRLVHVQFARLNLFSCEPMHCGSHKALPGLLCAILQSTDQATYARRYVSVCFCEDSIERVSRGDVSDLA